MNAGAARVVPAQAGTHAAQYLDSRLRGNDIAADR
jgi:hypothetical protein